ncbi:MAG: iduronate-2-sulfatase, partial [Akkermansiaceae bacterium]|nr:iduronate-2-sulfatase [Akkermansiaceae bacterium]
FHLGEHGNFAWGKSWNTEQANQCPLMIAAPEIAPAECNSLVELVDIYPTLLALLELPVEEPIDGISLVPLLEDPQRTVKPAAFSEYRTNSRHGG